MKIITLHEIPSNKEVLINDEQITHIGENSRGGRIVHLGADQVPVIETMEEIKKMLMPVRKKKNEQTD